MVKNIWKICDGIHHIVGLNEIAWRIAAAQEYTTTRKLVDSIEEQKLLDELIESSQIQIDKDSSAWHPLLFTPFRLPPLKYGSRFGNRFEPSLWYGALNLETAMAEVAYYRLNFLRASEAKFGIVETSLNAFAATVKTRLGIGLDQSPFLKYKPLISSPSSYKISQALGTAMRIANVEAFCYFSARDPSHQQNIVLFTPNAFLHTYPNPKSFQLWQCIATEADIEFTLVQGGLVTEHKTFSVSTFLVDGQLPFPGEN